MSIKKILNIAVIAALYSLTSCAPDQVELKGEVWGVSDKLENALKLSITNNYIVVNNLLEKTELTAINLNDHTKSFNFGERGLGSGYLYEATSITSKENIIDVFVPSRGAMVHFDLSDADNNQNIKISETHLGTINEQIIANHAMLSDSSYFITGAFQNRKRYVMMDKRGKNRIYLGEYPRHPQIDETTTYNVEGIAFRSQITTNNNGNKIAVATTYGGQIDLYKYKEEGRLIIPIASSKPKEFEFEITSSNGFPDFQPADSTRWGYTSLSIDKDKIYALYSGRTQKGNLLSYYANTIHVYNWNAKIETIINLDRDLLSIAVKDDKIYGIYQINDKAYDIVEYKLGL